MSDQALQKARFQITIHRSIGQSWHTVFSTMDEAAQSWLDYQTQNSPTSIEEWFNTVNPGAFPYVSHPMRL